jgi:hypothetical protein
MCVCDVCRVDRKAAEEKGRQTAHGTNALVLAGAPAGAGAGAGAKATTGRTAIGSAALRDCVCLLVRLLLLYVLFDGMTTCG